MVNLLRPAAQVAVAVIDCEVHLAPRWVATINLNVYYGQFDICVIYTFGQLI